MHVFLRDEAPTRRRGAVFVSVVVMLMVIVGFAALTIDVGNLYVAKGDLQRAADSAALAGASAFADNELRVLAGSEDEFYVLASEEAKVRAAAYSIRNPSTGVATLLDTSDIVVGYWDATNPTAPLDTSGRPNAVQVTARFTSDSLNGPVSNIFATVMGFKHTDVAATGTAAFDTRMAGFIPGQPGNLIPFTIHEEEWEWQVDNGPDEFSYDEQQELVINLPDTIREVVMFPYKDDPPGHDGAGNFGILNIGLGNQATTGVEAQITDGVTPEQLEAETGESVLTFVDENGQPTTYEITGNPGMKGGMADTLEAKVGQTIGFFLHTNLVDTGSNAIYTIVKIEFGRILEVDLTGKPENRRVRIQPVIMTDGGVGTEPGAEIDGEVGRLMLVQ